MKYHLFLLLFAIGFSTNSFSQETDDEFKNMAKDMCACVNKHVKKLSKGMQQAIIASGQDGADMEQIIQEQVMKDPEQGMKDVDAIMEVAEGVEECGKDIESQYSDIYSTLDKDELNQRLILVLSEEKGCEFTHALMKIGMREDDSNDYYDEEYYYDEEGE